MRVELVEEESVREGLPHLHDSDDGGVDLVLSVLEHALFRRLLLIVRLFQLNLEAWGNELSSVFVYSSQSGPEFNEIHIL